MMTELERLIKEKKELERRIAVLSSGAIVNDFAKLDMVKMGGEQKGKWAVFYRYFFIVRRGRYGDNEEWQKWVPIFCPQSGSREEAVKEIPNIIKHLQALYEEAVKNDADT